MNIWFVKMDGWINEIGVRWGGVNGDEDRFFFF